MEVTREVELALGTKDTDVIQEYQIATD